jgi:TetR/AcrR family transcriptional repressor of mexJK operon
LSFADPLVKNKTVRYGQKMLTTSEIPPAESGKSELRRRAILDVAQEAFLSQGFAATSMSEIATRLGGSKGTLYNYFRSKEDLFAALMVDICQGPANAVFDHMPPPDGDLRDGLIELGSGLLGFILSGPSIAVHRVGVAEAGRFPQVGRIFYETGPERGSEKLADHFTNLIAAGKIKPVDPRMAGQRFKDLVLSDIYSRRLWGVIGDLTAAQIREHVEEAVDIFLTVFDAVSA